MPPLEDPSSSPAMVRHPEQDRQEVPISDMHTSEDVTTQTLRTPTLPGDKQSPAMGESVKRDDRGVAHTTASGEGLALQFFCIIAPATPMGQRWYIMLMMY